jgi:hypothetical protein
MLVALLPTLPKSNSALKKVPSIFCRQPGSRCAFRFKPFTSFEHVPSCDLYVVVCVAHHYLSQLKNSLAVRVSVLGIVACEWNYSLVLLAISHNGIWSCGRAWVGLVNGVLAISQPYCHTRIVLHCRGHVCDGDSASRQQALANSAAIMRNYPFRHGSLPVNSCAAASTQQRTCSQFSRPS